MFTRYINFKPFKKFWEIFIKWNVKFLFYYLKKTCDDFFRSFLRLSAFCLHLADCHGFCLLLMFQKQSSLAEAFRGANTVGQWQSYSKLNLALNLPAHVLCFGGFQMVNLQSIDVYLDNSFMLIVGSIIMEV